MGDLRTCKRMIVDTTRSLPTPHPPPRVRQEASMGGFRPKARLRYRCGLTVCHPCDVEMSEKREIKKKV